MHGENYFYNMPEINTEQESINDPIATEREKEHKEYAAFLEKAKEEFRKAFGEKPPFVGSMMRTLNFQKVIGRGSFGVVKLVMSEVTGEYFAVKIVEKEFLVRTRQVGHALNELKVSYALRFPFVLSTLQFHQDNSYLYYVMPFVVGGDLFSHLRRRQSFPEDLACFYAVQVTLALEYMHALELVHRDIKPENILMDEHGYIKLMDFGLAKRLKAGRAYTTVGTPEYMAPELVLNVGYGFGVDWWAMGILIFEMCAGHAPFTHRSNKRLYEKIARGKFSTPKSFSPSLAHLLRNLIQPDVSRRLGALKNGASDIKKHRWFRSVNWLDIFHRKTKPTFVPEVVDPGNLGNFLPDDGDNLQLHVSEEDKYREHFRDF